MKSVPNKMIDPFLLFIDFSKQKIGSFEFGQIYFCFIIFCSREMLNIMCPYSEKHFLRLKFFFRYLCLFTKH